MPAPKPAKKRAVKPASKAIEVLIDYPLEGEKLGGGHYALRLTAERATEAEIRVNGEEWRTCRTAVGHFWLDWYPQRAGVHQFEARARIGKGRWAKSLARTCAV